MTAKEYFIEEQRTVLGQIKEISEKLIKANKEVSELVNDKQQREYELNKIAAALSYIKEKETK